MKEKSAKRGAVFTSLFETVLLAHRRRRRRSWSNINQPPSFSFGFDQKYT